MTKIQEAALQYAERGWHVLPVGSNKAPLTSRGVKDATRDPETIRNWPRAATGVAIACGPSDLLVVDIDGPDALRRWKFIAGEDWKDLTPAIVRTSRGVHLYFKGARKVPAHLTEGVDLKSSGGYVIAPPSVHATGHVYSWAAEGTPAPFPEIPLSVEPPPAATGDVLTIGNRNLGLTRQAGVLRRAGLSGGELLAILQQRNACLNQPLTEREVKQIAASAARNFSAELEAPLTDSGNAERLLARFGDVLRYCPAWRTWLFWNGLKWEKNGGKFAARLLTEEIALDMRMIAAQEDDKKRQREFFNAAKRLGQRIGTEGAMYAAEGRALTEEDTFDSHPHLLNVANGTLHLKSGTLRAPNREDYLTKQTRVGYHANAACPRWEAFLEQILPDKTLRGFIQMAAGYSLTGSVQEQCLFFLHGTGANGKTTLVEALLWVLGDYGRKIGPDLLLPKRTRGAAPEIVGLRGVRLAVASELGLSQALPEARIKNMTGGDTVSGRGLYEKDMTSFVSTHKLWIFGNHKPAIRGTDEGIWRRIRLLEFGVGVAPVDQDLQLLDKLKDEGEGILAWMVEGYRRWLGAGLPEVEGIAEAVAGYRAKEDNVAQWLAAECIVGKRLGMRGLTKSEAAAQGVRWSPAVAAAADLMASWKSWVFRTFEGHQKGLSWRRTVPERLRKLGLTGGYQEGVKVWFGIALRERSAVSKDGEIHLFL